MKKSIINTAVGVALGVSAMTATTVATAAVNTFDWDGYFTMLDSAGAALANTSITGKNANQFQTPVTGTMQFDTVTGAGTATVVPFDFFGGSLPAEAVGINMQAIGDGMGGDGTLVLGNMLFNWDGNNGIPVSIVLDAQGFFANDLDGTGGLGATPASDGTYTNPTFGYLGLGPIPIATTAWNTTANCTPSTPEPNPTPGDCLGNGVNGILPLVNDSFQNANDFSIPGALTNTGGTDGLDPPSSTWTDGTYTYAFGIGGSPMLDGPFTNFNANFDVTLLTFVSQDPNGTLPPNCDFDPSGNCFQPPAIPIPAAVWLFGSGLLGLVGVARRRKS